jgi:hypothetical protein
MQNYEDALRCLKQCDDVSLEAVAIIAQIYIKLDRIDLAKYGLDVRACGIHC